jgi:hypothetical protein
MSEAVRRVLDERSTFEHEGPRPLARPVDAPEPVPLTALGPLRLPAEAIHAHTRAPLAICAQAVLGALALIGQGHAVAEKSTEPYRLYLSTYPCRASIIS